MTWTLPQEIVWAVVVLAVIVAVAAVILAVIRPRARSWRLGIFYEREQVERPPVDDGQALPGDEVD